MKRRGAGPKERGGIVSWLTDRPSRQAHSTLVRASIGQPSKLNSELKRANPSERQQAEPDGFFLLAGPEQSKLFSQAGQLNRFPKKAKPSRGGGAKPRGS